MLKNLGSPRPILRPCFVFGDPQLRARTYALSSSLNAENLARADSEAALNELLGSTPPEHVSIHQNPTGSKLCSTISRQAPIRRRVVTLQELSELLSISTEDTLAGSFHVDSFVRELVKILRGTRNATDDDDNSHEQDEDAQLAAAPALSGGGQYQGDDNLEAQVLAARCLANLMEALPGVAHTVVYRGAIPVLCSKLIEILYVDLAEQTLSVCSTHRTDRHIFLQIISQTLEKISEEFPSFSVLENGLAALLNYLDFFSIAVQRTALQAASNCCRNVPPEHFQMIRSVWPIIRNCLGYSDQRLVEIACLCVIQVIEPYYRSSPENLEILVDAVHPAFQHHSPTRFCESEERRGVKLGQLYHRLFIFVLGCTQICRRLFAAHGPLKH
jgi:hypothetical protein